ncbi:hypothetical protein G7070_08375 [Propioniciclava coleopterorum]|uniref:DUF2231 domain-containing protein n=1 Tax=Propioniciclava coleopterorum TaxID=2714937 RepID=A0A6G7Y658_9ACTN|nr:DUF2231 domain-containing protein [Propioniciclava coleopterorum]QIK72280.1 hypothetical protein G7070_08375 [Propioniciclava coleopterorum]
MDVLGLPLHPLIVHAAVILVPLAALGALTIVVSARARARFGTLVAGVAVVAAASAFAAMLTGPLLADEIGVAGSTRIARHQQFGTWTPWPTLVLALAVPLHLWVRRPGGERGAAAVLVGGVIVVASLAALVLIVLTGHAGATAVWGS